MNSFVYKKEYDFCYDFEDIFDYEVFAAKYKAASFFYREHESAAFEMLRYLVQGIPELEEQF